MLIVPLNAQITIQLKVITLVKYHLMSTGSIIKHFGLSFCNFTNEFYNGYNLSDMNFSVSVEFDMQTEYNHIE